MIRPGVGIRPWNSLIPDVDTCAWCGIAPGCSSIGEMNMKLVRQLDAATVRKLPPWPEELMPWLGILFAARPPVHRVTLRQARKYSEVRIGRGNAPAKVLYNQEAMLQACARWVAVEQDWWQAYAGSLQHQMPDHHRTWELIFGHTGVGSLKLVHVLPRITFRWRDRQLPENAIKLPVTFRSES